MTVAAPAELRRPAFFWAPQHTSSSGEEAVVWTRDVLGLDLDPEQEFAIMAILAEGEGKRWAALEAAVIEARQNGKTMGVVLPVVMADVFLFGARLVTWTAHLFTTAQESFRAVRDLVVNVDELRGAVKRVSQANGEEEVELVGGGRIKWLARSKTGGRGLTGNRVVLDEAFALTAAHMGALVPTLATKQDAQIMYASSAGLEGSDILRGIRDRGRAGGDPSLVYLEWSAPRTVCGEDECDHALVRSGCALDDEGNWAAANPAMSRGRISAEIVGAMRRAMPPAEFAREVLGWWDEPAGSAAAFGVGKWEACVGDAAPEGTRLGALAAAVSFDQSWGAVGGAAHVDDIVYVKPLQHGPGTGWLVDRVVELQQRHGVEVVVDGRGPAAELIPDLVEAGVRLRVADTADVLDACAGIFAAVQDRRLRHQAFAELDTSVGGAVKRPVGDRWAWGRRQSTSDISVLETVTLAAWAARRPEPVVRPMVAVR